MKCKFCKAKIQKTDEICPECGKYINKKSAAAAHKQTAEPISSSPFGKNIKMFECKGFGENVLAKCLIYGIGFLVAVIGSLYFRYASVIRSVYPELIAKNALLIGACLLFIAAGIAIFFTCRKSFVCINVFGVYGIKPKFLLIPERFEFFYDDITDFRCRIPAGRGLAVVTVTAKGKVYRIYGLENRDASYLSTFVREVMPEKKQHKKHKNR